MASCDIEGVVKLVHSCVHMSDAGMACELCEHAACSHHFEQSHFMPLTDVHCLVHSLAPTFCFGCQICSKWSTY